MPLGMEVSLGPGHIVLDGDPAPTKGAQQPPQVTHMSNSAANGQLLRFTSVPSQRYEQFL